MVNKKISEARKKFLRENPDKHPWRNSNKFKSVPCETLKDKLKEIGYIFEEEYQDPNIKRHFSLDIAFPDKKFAIEVNGNQHYNHDGSLKDYYKERHDIFVENGWVIIELHYSEVYDENIILKLQRDMMVKPNFEYSSCVREYNDRKLKHEHRLHLIKTLKCVKEKKRTDLIFERLMSSDINFNKFGWVSKAALLIGITPQNVGYWMDRHYPNFYKKCFVRKPIKK